MVPLRYPLVEATKQPIGLMIATVERPNVEQLNEKVSYWASTSWWMSVFTGEMKIMRAIMIYVTLVRVVDKYHEMFALPKEATLTAPRIVASLTETAMEDIRASLSETAKVMPKSDDKIIITILKQV